ncbi:MAG: LysR substrate-binding domain-containing protein [Hyphomicrobiales bacterium]
MKKLSQINLSALRAFEAVARLGSVRAAAVELGVTAGAVSQQILKAEAQLARKLFERSPQGMAPTKKGAEIAEHLSEGFGAIARGVALSDIQHHDTITISVAPIFAAKWLVRRLGDFSAAHPDISVRIDASSVNVTPEPGDVDACIRVGLGNWAGVKVEEIINQRVFPVCAPKLAEHITDISSLKGVPIIREKNNQWFNWNAWLSPNGASEDILGAGPVFSDASLCLDAAAAGQGVFLSLETLARDALDLGHLVPALPGRFPTNVSYWFVESAGHKRSENVKAFRNWIFSELQK